MYGDSVDKVIQGNAQPLDALIATPMGWVRNGDIQVGDEVLTPHGTVTTVTGVYPQGIRPVYEIELRDGSKAESCDEHLWQIERGKTSISYTGVIDANGNRKYIGTGPNGQTHKMVTEIINTDELKLRIDKGRQINLPRIEPLAYSEQDLPIDPYVLGVLLGDGRIFENGSVMITNGDSYVVDKLATICNISKHNNKGTSHEFSILGIAPSMRELGLEGKRSYSKFIPEQYLYGSVEQRIELLRGLMDTDGYISKSNEMEYCTTSEQLARDVQTLIRSLGGRVSINVKDNVYYTSPTQKTRTKARDAYRLQNIRLQKINPFSLPRKSSRWVERDDNSGNRVVGVRYLRDEAVQCISVEDDMHLYITDDFLPTHNTENIVFLKSTDNEMIDTLVKMSGTKHETRTDQKTITRDNERLLSKNEGKISYTMATKEVPVIDFNDFMFIKERNSIIIKAGGSPIWNREESAYPMSWRLFKDTIKLPGKSFSLQTTPTNSTAIDFDVRKNQPNFFNMLDVRLKQARLTDKITELYVKAYGLSENDLIRLNQNVVADDIMHAINSGLYNIEHRKAKDVEREKDEAEVTAEAMDDMGIDPSLVDTYNTSSADMAEDNKEIEREAAQAGAKQKEHNIKRYAGKHISREDLVSLTGGVLRSLDTVLARAYDESKQYFIDDVANYRYDEDSGELSSSTGIPYVKSTRGADKGDFETLLEAETDDNTRVYGNDGQTGVYYNVTDDFIRHLSELNSWSDIANGHFEMEARRAFEQLKM